MMLVVIIVFLLSYCWFTFSHAGPSPPPSHRNLYFFGFHHYRCPFCNAVSFHLFVSFIFSSFDHRHRRSTFFHALSFLLPLLLTLWASVPRFRPSVALSSSILSMSFPSTRYVLMTTMVKNLARWKNVFSNPPFSCSSLRCLLLVRLLVRFISLVVTIISVVVNKTRSSLSLSLSLSLCTIHSLFSKTFFSGDACHNFRACLTFRAQYTLTAIRVLQ